LAIGAIVAILVRRPGWDRQQVLRLSILLWTLAILIAVAGYPFRILTRRTPIGEALQHVPWNFAFAGLLGVFLLIGRGEHKSFVTPAFLLFFGQISYGLYLYHLMAFSGYAWLARKTNFESQFHLTLWEQVWARMLIAGTGAVVVAHLSRRYFEEPFLRLKDRLPERSALASLEIKHEETKAAD
jgi:peptidoglycan/LPS O-acetylase OafA/YrhL